jgi:hypothetical protein
VSVALRLIGQPDLSWALLWVAAVTFAVLVVASVWRVAAFGSQVRGELGRPDRLFSWAGVVAWTAGAAPRGSPLPSGRRSSPG